MGSQLRPSQPQQQKQKLVQAAAAKPAHQARPHRQIMAEVKPTKSGEVEVEAHTLKQSLAEAHKMGFKGHPEAIVYHPAHGRRRRTCCRRSRPCERASLEHGRIYLSGHSNEVR